MGAIRFAAILVIALVLAGCNRSAGSLNTRLPPEPLPSSPTEPVTSGELQPVQPEIQVASENLQNETPTAPTTPEVAQQSQVASLEQPKATGQKITREGMAGSWNVPSDNAQCRIILAFTKWSGGYRAATRRCNSVEIGAVTAWDVKGQQVVLVDGAGTTIARLYASGASRYDGTLNSGKAITFAR